jgi:hypothetical protein
MQSRVNKKFAAACLLVPGAAAVACVSAAWTVSRQQSATSDPVSSATEVILSASEVVALRFPDDLEIADIAQPVERGEATARADTGDIGVLFNPLPTYPTTVAPPEAAPMTPPAAPAAIELASLTQAAPPSQAQLTAAANKLAIAAAHPHPTVNARPGAVLSDGQIANIKQRLKLTPDQQQMWPAVEVALRNLNYGKKADGAHRNAGSQDATHRVATLDTDSDEVQHLTSAAFPLIMSFSDDQKRELHVLAHVAGLEQLVPKF